MTRFLPNFLAEILETFIENHDLLNEKSLSEIVKFIYVYAQ
ncbi:Hypothetical protein LOCK908_1443 [Lacticaseibacillus rhamnosus LOCK908]|uniref:Uncharacterized protein n=2 Tax=Lacticaseibacillus rhamnosus TaxID=47715 RepID=C2JWW7_LACRM|nr:conserved hypothetical protein [Lacticaseibacillus rhamnosus ATCC 8530]AGP71170.1 Hypothetical protein LOCK900_1361 [Lacticaseibacillus rhamnosus LOCK900]AGP74082.1 Hypothetical protein LOCK908_1443 [Lacticaseibacillus rhamnosus LOCK908]ASY47311.1 hypothetical protein N507_0116 [Lacticaseibacillus rhamnosus DSM 14870]EEN80457.1 hypothetical protein HMPREF0539_1438 [Lacticaseibacillus rhamnosus LMS2-1]EHJ34225.1 hypothetical protein HMPREF0541_00759 [Lacticaseibacillus rhamnosus ATCC 21052]